MSVTVEGGENIGKLASIFEKAQEHALRQAATYLEGKVKEKFTGDNNWAANKPATIKKKGSSRPLMDTGALRASIMHVVEGDTAKVGVIGDPYNIVTRKAITPYAASNEFGSPARNIPERSFLRSTFNIEKEEIKKIIDEKFKEAMH